MAGRKPELRAIPYGSGGVQSHGEDMKERLAEDRKTDDVGSSLPSVYLLQKMPGIGISFNCAVCGQRMDELTDDGICAVCKEALTSSVTNQ